MSNNKENIFTTQDSEFRSFLGRIEETINCFRDLLAFTYKKEIILIFRSFQMHPKSKKKIKFLIVYIFATNGTFISKAPVIDFNY